MVSVRKKNPLGISSLITLPISAALALMPPAIAGTAAKQIAQNADPILPSDSSGTPLDLTDPNNLRPLTQGASILSLQSGQRLTTEARQAIETQDYTTATQKLQQARQIFNQLSNFYQQLSGSFSGIDNRIYDSLRKKALDTAELRDRATYELAVVHKAQNQPELAVPLLVQIIKSQNPTRELGKTAYQELVTIGFIDNGLQDGQRLMNEATQAVDNQNYELAAQKLQQARQIFNLSSNFYQQLASSFSGIDNQIFDTQRQKAVENGEMRDKATYQLALVHRAQNQPELSVPLLIQIIRSQNPTSELGKKAYQQLFEIGFVDSPYAGL
ncbi:MAG TPA: hypothetical protein DEG17_10510 [Cyanobacteria bacterium UBA11149]|nr:hypothetical protein [Cyanobacteria bacterium UBA11367]HBE56432.1 hypothetical protein [Cyanobacteria bacterium UBA11366]HBK66571.1 hypothetical protein [Cyanobacteria bacterium UBA11166]HBR72938.1 hypothetical protein [Cyanobacteria bacterium UBA11159]HBS70913.1 hypothetical protein [Cyanobacteria bacterium UBA11153]HBW89281.1 hypothetical protein [Cyanobacteria bacterium UBA11149]HCA97435.1 hypothetical protein [Cyanobacteria bacterium UBA9226]